RRWRCWSRRWRWRRRRAVLLLAARCKWQSKSEEGYSRQQHNLLSHPEFTSFHASVEIVLARIFISHKFAPVARGFSAWETTLRIDKAAVWLNFLAVKRRSRAHLAFGEAMSRQFAAPGYSENWPY